MTQRPQLPQAGGVLAGIRAMLPVLKPSERRVAEAVLSRPGWAIEGSAQDLAAAADVSRATVVRTAQRLGYSGLPQLRVLLARDVGRAGSESRPEGAGVSRLPAGPTRTVLDFCSSVVESLQALTTLLDADDVDHAVTVLAGAQRILVGGHGVSAPVAAEAAMRLSAIGHPAEAPQDALDQEIKARLLSQADACLLISGTGATRSTVAVAQSARAAGASIVALTGFHGSPLSKIADVTLTAGFGGDSLQEELRAPLRIPPAVLVNALVPAVVDSDPARALAARDRVLEVVGDAFTDQPDEIGTG